MSVASHENILFSRNNILNFRFPGLSQRASQSWLAEREVARGGWRKDDACIVVIYLRSDGCYRFARSRVVRLA